MKVKLTYFKVTGKFHTSGEYESGKPHLHEIWDEVRQMKEEGKLPETTGKEWIVYVDVPEHIYNHPRLIV